MVPTAIHSDSSQLTPRKFHIFGNGISFSVSPIIHNAGFSHHGLPHTYDIQEAPDMNGVAHFIRSDSFGGASITMPHKLQADGFCEERTETAKAIGAINTLVVKDKNGKRIVTGDNTDWSGLASLIDQYAKQSQTAPNVGLVIGAGGASRAALYAMHRAGLRNLYVQNRTKAKAEEVREAFAPLFEVTVLDSLQGLPELPDVIIGTVPAHTTEESQFHGIFGKQGICIEMSYKPRMTALLKVAQKHAGWKTVTGIEVLLAQAYDQYRLWTGKEPPREEMIRAVDAHESKVSARLS